MTPWLPGGGLYFCLSRFQLRGYTGTLVGSTLWVTALPTGSQGVGLELHEWTVGAGWGRLWPKLTEQGSKKGSGLYPEVS